MTNKINDVTLLAIFKEANQTTPKGFRLLTKRQSPYIYLRIPLQDGDTQRSTNEPLTATGIREALNICNQAHEVIKKGINLDAFNHWWYDRVSPHSVLGKILRVSDAIESVDASYWGNRDREGRSRDKGNKSHQATYNRCYGTFYNRLEDKLDRPISPKAIYDVLMLNYSNKRGTKQFKEAVNAYAKLFRETNRKTDLDLFLELAGDTKQTEFREVQQLDRIKLFNYLKTGKNTDRHNNIPWVNVFVIQLIYGLRISEVYAIANLNDEHTTQDGYTFNPVSEASEILPPILVQSTYSLDGHSRLTTKTGERVSMPIYCDDLAFHELITPKLNRVPLPRFEGDTNPETVANHARRALKKLTKGEYSQTHALRHLANYHAKLSGMSAEQRALSLGHSIQQNHGYNKHLGTKETINLLGVS